MNVMREALEKNDAGASVGPGSSSLRSPEPQGVSAFGDDPSRIVAGARVRIKNPERYVYAVRHLGNRLGTVERIFTPHGATRPIARVAFDFKRGKQPVEFFDPNELIAVARDSDRHPEGGNANAVPSRSDESAGRKASPEPDHIGGLSLSDLYKDDDK